MNRQDSEANNTLRLNVSVTHKESEMRTKKVMRILLLLALLLSTFVPYAFAINGKGCGTCCEQASAYCIIEGTVVESAYLLPGGGACPAIPNPW